VSDRVNVATRLVAAAAAHPDVPAIVAPRDGRVEQVTYRELDECSAAIAAGLAEARIRPGTTCLVMVRAGIDLITLTYALLKAGAVPVLIDPGMGLRAFLGCVERARPDVLIGIPLAHAVRLAFPGAFASVRARVTVGRRWIPGGTTLAALEEAGRRRGPAHPADTAATDTAAVLFTSGSTGPAKGAVYSHGNFDAQIRILGATYGFAPGEVDLAAFPLFSLFDGAFGMTSVIPELDPSRPGSCDAAKVVGAIRNHAATLAFGSPAIWRRVVPWCRRTGTRLPTLRRILIAGAPVPPALIEGLREVIAPGGDVETPYGATEALPVATIAGREILGETAARSREGAGTCVGRPVGGIDVRIIGIDDGPIAARSDARECATGEVGEIAVRGAVVTRSYHNLPDATRGAKIADGDDVWHRMGDVGYRDDQGRLWFCGRKAERVRTAEGTLFTDQIEGRAGAQPGVGRCALVGVGPAGQERPVLVVEGAEDAALARELHDLAGVVAVLFHPRFPVDVRHNAKIHRRTLKAWAERRLGVGA